MSATGQERRLDSVILWVEGSNPGANIDSGAVFIITGIVCEYGEAESGLEKERSAGRRLSSIGFMQGGKDYGTIRSPRDIVVMTTSVRGNRKICRAFGRPGLAVKGTD
ncbi:MAG: hypothetical protein LIO85_00770 [Rikenellaceae bacterium]|nr:hypothetical protein [Rikenellaceae bacterium]